MILRNRTGSGGKVPDGRAADQVDAHSDVNGDDGRGFHGDVAADLQRHDGEQRQTRQRTHRARRAIVGRTLLRQQ